MNLLLDTLGQTVPGFRPKEIWTLKWDNAWDSPKSEATDTLTQCHSHVSHLDASKMVRRLTLQLVFLSFEASILTLSTSFMACTAICSRQVLLIVTQNLVRQWWRFWSSLTFTDHFMPRTPLNQE
jgi:hypothetical protein